MHMFLENYYMSGDSAYILTSYMLTPYKENGYLTEKQNHYNYIQAGGYHKYCRENIFPLKGDSLA